MKHHTLRFILLLPFLAACQDLSVTNPNNPDRDRIASDPKLVEALIASTFLQFWPRVHDDSPVWAWSTMADEFTSGFLDFGIHDLSQEPRQAFNNSATYTRAFINREPWVELHSIMSSLNDGLFGIQRGLIIRQGGVDVTRRAEAFAKFMQGLALGHLALYFDQAYVVDENSVIDPRNPPAFRPYPEVMAAALGKLDDAIAISEANEFVLPNPPDLWLFSIGFTNHDLARLAHSYRARFMASVARTRAERDAADWSGILAHAAAGITSDFAPIAEPNRLVEDFRRVAARQRTTIPGDFARLDYWLVGPADSTNGFINWVNRPVAQRTPFKMLTKDRRIHPADQRTVSDTTTLRGRYFGYHRANIFAESRGTYHRSWYFYHRLGTGESWSVGPQLAMTVTEMRLLRAESLIRLGRAEESLPLINASRVANGELAPVTIAGPPDELGCVPRKLSGACGSLWDALRYEKRIEMAGIDATVAFLDARGWQTLVEGTPVHLPVPGRELESLSLPNYTFGGIGGPGSAPAPDRERCPVALPRCP